MDGALEAPNNLETTAATAAPAKGTARNSHVLKDDLLASNEHNSWMRGLVGLTEHPYAE